MNNKYTVSGFISVSLFHFIDRPALGLSGPAGAGFASVLPVFAARLCGGWIEVFVERLRFYRWAAPDAEIYNLDDTDAPGLRKSEDVADTNRMARLGNELAVDPHSPAGA